MKFSFFLTSIREWDEISFAEIASSINKYLEILSDLTFLSKQKIL
jgi:hypothetical protein